MKFFYELNFIRGFACLMVVMVHVTASFYYFDEKQFNWLTMFLNQVSRFGTPLFAVIAGFLLFNQSFKGRFKVKRFVVSRTKKILIPFAIWSFVYLYYKSYVFPWQENGVKYADFFQLFLLGDAQYHLYFLIVVLQFYVLFLILQFVKTNQMLIFLTIVSFFVNYFFIRKPFDFGNEMLNTILQDRSSLFFWIFYFFLGGLFAMNWEKISQWVRENIILTMFIGFTIILFAIYEYHAFTQYSSTRVANLLYIPLFFLFLTAMYYLLGKFAKLREGLIKIGNLSMGIYLVHPLILLLLEEHFPFLFDRTRWIILAYFITVLLSILLVKLIQLLPFSSFIVTVAGDNKRKRIDKKGLMKAS